MRTFALLGLAIIGGMNPAMAHAGKRDRLALDNLDLVGGAKATLIGSPSVIQTPQGKARRVRRQKRPVPRRLIPWRDYKSLPRKSFSNPIHAGAKEQRFVHFQEEGSDNRLLFEIRLTDDDRWFLDTFIKSGAGNYTLLAEKSLHPIGPWYHAAVVMDGKAMRHYVNGDEELSSPISFSPQKEGQTSIGVRLNRVSWYKGAVQRVRITPRVLTPQEFLPH